MISNIRLIFRYRFFRNNMKIVQSIPYQKWIIISQPDLSIGYLLQLKILEFLNCLKIDIFFYFSFFLFVTNSFLFLTVYNIYF